ncbi:DUF1127 domain-containing protein [Paracoccus marinaquae]|uniref:DUF1127 domain-containing protein n=1 Tax=Paracoccus marinaquae TaxID=2841926 RepID=A0ABS6AJS5_9RHOB|nr:DUF1127 domain-containing protein [Paracoccus marinaquae]MBU3029889.1 DUF1127 domain-containing protein [Paracoccus marinaquae]
MAQRSTALLRVVTGRGIIPRPAWLEQLLTLFDRRQKTIALDRLSDSQLQDIGLTRAEVDEEMRRPAWDAPLHWYRG